ncbi:hypothetical protein Tco_0423511, partial [Tanacetum coccineum]
IASGAEPPKTKASIKKKQPAKTSKAKGVTVLSKVALTEVEQIKLATKRNDEQISWKSSDEEDNDEVSLNDDDDDDDDVDNQDDDNQDDDNQDDDDQEHDDQDDDANDYAQDKDD